MKQQQIVSHIGGVDVSEYRSVQLSKDKFISANFELYPKECYHLLIHAIQFQLPIPTIKSMQRTQKRNKQKVLKNSGNTKPNLKAKKKSKSGGRKRVPGGFFRQQSNSSLIQKPASSNKVFNKIKIRSPEQIALKTAREQCLEQMKTWVQAQIDSYSQSDSSNQSSSSSAQRPPLPIYFKKKNKSHWRRLKQRAQLVKANREKLIDLYGYEIMRKDCRVGIKDIKTALGLVEKGMDAEGVREFMQMVDESSESSNKN